MLVEYILCVWIFSFCRADTDETLLFCDSSPPKLIHGLIKRDRVSFYHGQGYLGNMEYMCLPGFNLLGNKVVTCRNGKWSSIGQCIPKKRCLPIRNYPLHTIVESQNITVFQNDPNQIIVGSTVTLRCEENYQFETTTNHSLLLHCQTDGTWTSMPSCRYAQTTCDYSKLYLPARSRITRMNFQFSETNRQLHTVGSHLEYTCEDGYRLHDGQASLTVECLSSGSWSPLPVCEFVYQTVSNALRCSYPAYIKNGFMTVYNVTIWEDQTYTGRVVYECNYGFETPEGGDRVTSDCINGSWSNVVDCQEIPTCPKQELLEIEGQVENSYVHNVSLQYVRDPMAFVYDSYVYRVCLPTFEYDPAGPPLKIQCRRQTNTWTGIPVCRALATTTPLARKISISADVPRTTLATSTKRYYITNQAEVWASTMAVDNTTDSTTQRFETTDTVVCSSNDIPSIPNAAITPLEVKPVYYVGVTLFFTCLSGSSFNQSSFTVCSSNGKWSTETLNLTMCQQSSVDEETTAESVVETSSVSDTTLEEGDGTTIDFDEDLPPLHLPTESFPSSTRSISSSDRQVRHVTSYCKQLPRIEHAQLLHDETIQHHANNDTNYTGSLVFICQYGFKSDTLDDKPIRLTCRDGAFYPLFTCLEKPRCSLPPPIDLTRTTVVASFINVFDTSTQEAIPGSFILLQCSEKSTFNMTCLDTGQWVLPSSSCFTPFKRRCQSGIAIPNARTEIHAKLTPDGLFNDGSRAAYRCLVNFAHDQQSGPLHIQCNNGRWGPRPRCIPNGCLDPLPDTIDHGWKSAESYLVHNQVKYHLLARYSCHENATMADSSSPVVDIECRNNQWPHKSLPECKLKE